MSARNLALSLISPSHSVLTKAAPIKPSSARESRLTCASFHKCSITSSLVSWESSLALWAAAGPSEKTANNKQQQVERSMILLVRRIPTCGERCEKIAGRGCLAPTKFARVDYEC